MRTLLQIAPILAALRRHKAAVLLLVLEIALTLAVLGNLVFVVNGTLQRSRTPTGVMEPDLAMIQSISVIGQHNPGTVGDDLARLRAVPGVVAASYGGPPLWYASPGKVFRDADRQHQAAEAYDFVGGQDLAETLGVRVVEGQGFHADDRADAETWGSGQAVSALITRALATQLFPDGHAVGRTFYSGTGPVRVIGVIDHLRGELTGRVGDDYSMVVEYQVGPQDMGGGFLIRSRPGQLDAALKGAADVLQKANPGHVQQRMFTMAQARADYFRSDMAAGRMLVAVMAILLLVTALGVSGLASFWVQQRRRQIGMRRALGASRGDILRYFQTENFLIVGAGVALGVLLAYVLNLFLMHRFELDRLPPGYLALGALALWALGQLAVLGPALRAAAVPPVVATRGA